MGILNTTLYGAEVHYYGGVRPSDPDDEPIFARVDAPDPPAISNGRNGLVLLVALLGPYHLYRVNANDEKMVEPMLELIEGGAREMLSGEQSARQMTYSESNLYVDMPVLVEDPQTAPSRSWRGTLMRGRGEYLWVKTRGRNPYFAIAGHLLLAEWVARNGDYERTVVPMAVGMLAFIDLIDSIEDSWRTIGRRLPDLLWAAVLPLVVADDPRAELERARIRQADAFGESLDE